MGLSKKEENMLSSISKIELAERARRMRAAKDNLVSKEIAPTGVVHVQFEQDEHTASGIIFKRMRSKVSIPSEQ